MTRRLAIVLILLFAIVLLIDGRAPKQLCDPFLRLEWGSAMTRYDNNLAERRPTQKELGRLRNVIRVCSRFSTQFDLIGDIVNEGEVYGSATTLNLAVELDDVELLEELVSNGHSADGLPNSYGVSSLFVATYRMAGNAFYWALERGIDPNLTDAEGMSPLMIAARRPQDQLQSIRALLNAGADADPVLPNGATPLAGAIRDGRFENAAQLVDAGADIERAKTFLIEIASTAHYEEAKHEILALIISFDEYRENRKPE